MQILDGVTLVGSGWLGFSLSSRYDCHVYLLHDGATGLLIDAGCGLATSEIVTHIAEAGVDPRTIHRILLTHCHADHAAGAALLAAATGAEVVGSEWTARVLGRADERGAGLTAARRAGTYPDEVVLVPAPVTAVADGDEVGTEGISLTALATPGHARGHLCYAARWRDRTLVFSGDLVFGRGRVAVLATEDTDVRELAASIERVYQLLPDVLLPGHGSLVLSHAAAHLDTALGYFRDDLLPPGLT